MPIRVLVADDSALTRRVISKLLANDRRIEITGFARDGEDAIIKCREMKPDVLTLDINMPKMDGLTALDIIIKENICPVIMLSSLTQAGALTTFEALELGAFDYVGKPGGTISSNMDDIAKELSRKIKAAYRYKRFNKPRIQNHKVSISKPEKKKSLKSKNILQKSVKPKILSKTMKAVVIGISTGGPKTIFDVLPYIPADINAAIFMVQHMPPNFTKQYSERLNKSCQIEVKESEVNDVIRPGVCYVGKGGYHMTLLKRMAGDIVIRHSQKPEHTFIPSVSICMESVLKVFGTKTIGVEMTGMGDDGADAMSKIKQAGGYCICESEESCVVFGMPQQAIQKGGSDIVLPSWEIAEEIIKAVSK